MTAASQGILRVKVLDVGQGDAIVIFLPDSRRALIVDAFDGERVLAALEANAVDEVVLFLSHSDVDHVDGVQYLLDNYQGDYKAFIYNRDRIRSRPEAEYRALLSSLGRATRRAKVWSDDFNTNLHHDARFAEFVRDPVTIEVLHPTHDEQSSLLGHSTNESSGVLRIDYTFSDSRRRSVLLAADLQLTGVSCILHRFPDASEKLRADILKFPHHGAWPSDYPGIGEFPEIRRCTMTDFLEAVDPEIVFLSVGLQNAHGHVRPEVFSALHSLHKRKRRLKRIVCTQITNRCLRSGQHCTSPACGGDVEVCIGEGVRNGMEVFPAASDHLARILSLTDRKHAACAPLLPRTKPGR